MGRGEKEREREMQPLWEQGSGNGKCQGLKSVTVEGLSCKEDFPGDNLDHKKGSLT